MATPEEPYILGEIDPNDDLSDILERWDRLKDLIAWPDIAYTCKLNAYGSFLTVFHQDGKRVTKRTGRMGGLVAPAVAAAAAAAAAEPVASTAQAPSAASDPEVSASQPPATAMAASARGLNLKYGRKKPAALPTSDSVLGCEATNQAACQSLQEDERLSTQLHHKPQQEQAHDQQQQSQLPLQPSPAVATPSLSLQQHQCDASRIPVGDKRALSSSTRCDDTGAPVPVHVLNQLMAAAVPCGGDGPAGMDVDALNESGVIRQGVQAHEAAGKSFQRLSSPHRTGTGVAGATAADAPLSGVEQRMGSLPGTSTSALPIPGARPPSSPAAGPIPVSEPRLSESASGKQQQQQDDTGHGLMRPGVSCRLPHPTGPFVALDCNGSPIHLGSPPDAACLSGVDVGGGVAAVCLMLPTSGGVDAETTAAAVGRQPEHVSDVSAHGTDLLSTPALVTPSGATAGAAGAAAMDVDHATSTVAPPAVQLKPDVTAAADDEWDIFASDFAPPSEPNPLDAVLFAPPVKAEDHAKVKTREAVGVAVFDGVAGRIQEVHEADRKAAGGGVITKGGVVTCSDGKAEAGEFHPGAGKSEPRVRQAESDVGSSGANVARHLDGEVQPLMVGTMSKQVSHLARDANAGAVNAQVKSEAALKVEADAEAADVTRGVTGGSICSAIVGPSALPDRTGSGGAFAAATATAPPALFKALSDHPSTPVGRAIAHTSSVLESGELPGWVAAAAAASTAAVAAAPQDRCAAAVDPPGPRAAGPSDGGDKIASRWGRAAAAAQSGGLDGEAHRTGQGATASGNAAAAPQGAGISRTVDDQGGAGSLGRGGQPSVGPARAPLEISRLAAFGPGSSGGERGDSGRAGGRDAAGEAAERGAKVAAGGAGWDAMDVDGAGYRGGAGSAAVATSSWNADASGARGVSGATVSGAKAGCSGDGRDAVDQRYRRAPLRDDRTAPLPRPRGAVQRDKSFQEPSAGRWGPVVFDVKVCGRGDVAWGPVCRWELQRVADSACTRYEAARLAGTLPPEPPEQRGRDERPSASRRPAIGTKRKPDDAVRSGTGEGASQAGWGGRPAKQGTLQQPRAPTSNVNIRVPPDGRFMAGSAAGTSAAAGTSGGVSADASKAPPQNPPHSNNSNAPASWNQQQQQQQQQLTPPKNNVASSPAGFAVSPGLPGRPSPLQGQPRGPLRGPPSRAAAAGGHTAGAAASEAAAGAAATPPAAAQPLPQPSRPAAAAQREADPPNTARCGGDEPWDMGLEDDGLSYISLSMLQFTSMFSPPSPRLYGRAQLTALIEEGRKFKHAADARMRSEGRWSAVTLGMYVQSCLIFIEAAYGNERGTSDRDVGRKSCCDLLVNIINGMLPTIQRECDTLLRQQHAAAAASSALSAAASGAGGEGQPPLALALEALRLLAMKLAAICRLKWLTMHSEGLNRALEIVDPPTVAPDAAATAGAAGGQAAAQQRGGATGHGARDDLKRTSPAGGDAASSTLDAAATALAASSVANSLQEVSECLSHYGKSAELWHSAAADTTRLVTLVEEQHAERSAHLAVTLIQAMGYEGGMWDLLGTVTIARKALDSLSSMPCMAA